VTWVAGTSYTREADEINRPLLEIIARPIYQEVAVEAEVKFNLV